MTQHLGNRPAVDVAVPRGSFRLVVDPVFGTFFWGKLVSACGIWIYNIVAVIVAYDISKSALTAGLVSVVHFAPQLALAPLSGKMADRGNPQRQIIVGRFVVGAGAGSLAVTLTVAGGVDELSTALPVLASSLVVGLGFVLGGPAMQSMVPEMVRPGELPAAMALNAAPMTFARAAGPALGAVVATQLGPVAALAIAVAVNVAFGLVLVAVRLPTRPAPAAGTDFSVRASFRYLRVDPTILVLLIGIAVVGFASEPTITLAPALAADLGGGTHLVGWLTSAFGIGAAAGITLFNSISRRFGLPRVAAVGLAVMAVGLTVTALVGATGVAIGGLAFAGIGMMMALTGISTLVQQRAPTYLRGRIMALWTVGFLGARPFAAAMNGWLADVATVQVALLGTVAVIVVATYLCRPSRLARPLPSTLT